MSKISTIILTKNSENSIADCIDSVMHMSGEIIVIDDSSTDRTVDLAKHLNCKVLNFHSESFAEKRNFGLKKAKYKWIFYIDDDERVTPELQSNILTAVEKENKKYVAYRVKRRNFYLGKNEWPFVENLERLFNKNYLKGWFGKLHESATVDGEIAELDGFLEHFSHQDLGKMVEKTAKWSGVEAELRFKADHPQMSSWRFFRVMVTAFYDSYFRQRGYKAGTAGLVESIYQSFSMFITYARLWELQNNQKNKNAKQ
jgi:glycosyltransferase involved in cell wall biosynthesis